MEHPSYYVARANPVTIAVLSALCFVLGVVIIMKPEVLTWILGIGAILGGVALFATLFTREPQ
jgi:uncharacterized membrane protein HdeD (DUF308 family)